MYSYKFNGLAMKPDETHVGNETPKGFIIFNGGEAVDWTKFNYQNGGLVEVIIPEPPAPPIPTPEEIKAQKLSDIQYSYQPKLDALLKSRSSAQIMGTQTTNIDASYKQLMLAMINEKKAVQ